MLIGGVPYQQPAYTASSELMNNSQLFDPEVDLRLRIECGQSYRSQ
jgi:hypothetical protein